MAYFITLEGVEGVGKTTNLSFIREWLEQRDIPLLVSREPGGTPLAEALRNLVLTPSDEKIDPAAELLMVFAARAQHINTLIRPALKQGTWVLCDRFTDASFAYQGAGRELGLEMIRDLETMVQGPFQPDLTIYLDCPPETGLQRARERSQPDRIEQESMAFFNRVRAQYLERAAQFPERFEIVDASQPLQQVQVSIRQILEERFSR